LSRESAAGEVHAGDGGRTRAPCRPKGHARRLVHPHGRLPRCRRPGATPVLARRTSREVPDAEPGVPPLPSRGPAAIYAVARCIRCGQGAARRAADGGIRVAWMLSAQGRPAPSSQVPVEDPDRTGQLPIESRQHDGNGAFQHGDGAPEGHRRCVADDRFSVAGSEGTCHGVVTDGAEIRTQPERAEVADCP
jgi:hypothetical protein